jgi:hypothetical protein
MERVESKDGLIRTRRAAIIALCITGYIAALSFWSLLAGSQHETFWLAGPGLLPSRTIVPVNLAFYAVLLWPIAAVCRNAPAIERLVLVGFFTGFFLEPIQNLVSASAATTIQYVNAFGMMVAFLAAVCILIQKSGDDVRRKSAGDSG